MGKKKVTTTTKDTKNENEFRGLKTDVIIIVMGPTGAGKSTFISKFTEDEPIAIGHTMSSCTQNVAWYHCQFPKTLSEDKALKLWRRRLILVDTPGFDDSRTEDINILEKVSEWLAQVYEEDAPVAGIVYITDITQKRMTGTSRLSFRVLQKLCGKALYRKVTMVTSHWTELPDKAAGFGREEELKKNFWQKIIEGGAGVRRIENDGDESRIIEAIIRHQFECEKQGKEETQPMTIQEEVVDLDRSTPETEAGRELKYNLKQLLRLVKEAQEKELDEKGKQELEQKKAAIEAQIEALKLTPAQRIKIFLRFPSWLFKV